MITVEELKCCLKEANFTEEAIDRICHKKIKALLKTGRYQEIKDILEVLEKKEISKEAIENCLSVLAKGKAKEIKEIFEILEEKEISKEKIENCLYVYGICKQGMYNDGGSAEYCYYGQEDNQYTILRLNTLDGDNDLVIGMGGQIINLYNKNKK